MIRIHYPKVTARLDGPAVAERLKTLAESGFFAAPLVLGRTTYTVSSDALIQVITMLDNGAGTLDELADQAMKCFVPIQGHKYSTLASSFYGRQKLSAGGWPSKGIMPGITVVIGESRSGKTTLIRGLGVDMAIRIAEPMELDDFNDHTFGVNHYLAAFGLVLAGAVSGRHVSLDSLRGMMYNLEGNTLEGGVSAGLFELLTTLNNLVAATGANVVMAVNPMTGDETKLATLLKRVEASVAGIIHVSNGAVALSAYRTEDGRRVSDQGPDKFSQGQPAFSSEGVETGHSSLMLNVRAMGGDSGTKMDISAARVFSTADVDDDEAQPRVFPTLRF